MIKIIENVLKDLVGMQLNLENDETRTWIAQRIEKAIVDNRKMLANKSTTKILKNL
jgi:hypothetical protein